jgi:hypothetical protein
VAPKAKLNLPKVSFFRDWLHDQVKEVHLPEPRLLNEVAA